MNQRTCDATRLSQFLGGDLSSHEELLLTGHLDQCTSCRDRLDELAADPASWTEAKEMLCDVVDQVTCTKPASNSDSLQIEQVLAQLGPTDDPESLGRIGGYEVTGVIGSGGMGVVLKAHDRSLDRVVAVKVMAPHLAASGSARQRFAREAKAAAAVLHPNVIAIHGVSNDQSLPYLVMPYVRGASLQKRIDAEGPLATIDILRIGSQVAAGLAAAHEQGLVHRDIKPANILLEQGVERVAITDFGLARAADDASMTRSGVIAGTPQYMSPEQARGEPIDARSDLFSLGSLLYAMCTGHSPFRAETSYGVLHRITHDAPRAIRELNPNIPEWLERIVLKLLSKSREDRFGSAEEVSELLEGCLAHVQHPTMTTLPAVVDEATSPVHPQHSGTRRFVHYRKLIAAAFAFFLFFAGVLIVLETNKGTLTIESELDNVPIRIMQGDKIVERLMVTKSGDSVRVAAGTYVVELETKFDGMVVENNQVSLTRGATEHVTIRLSTTNANAALGLSRQPPMTRTDSGTTWAASDAKAKIVVDLYSGRDVLVQMNTSGPNKAKHVQLVQDLNAIDGIQVNFREAGPGNEIAVAIVHDPAGLINQESLTTGKPSVRREAISKALAVIPNIRWEQGGQISLSPFDRMPPENEKMNMRFSETHEVVLSIGTLQFMLDLDAGETCPAPARNSDYLSKFEIHPTQDQPQEEPRGLTFPSLEATTLRLDTLSVAPEIWNLPDAEVFSALATTKPTPTQAIPLRDGSQNTYYFRTAQKTSGLIQLVGTERIKEEANEPWGIRIRYKKLQSSDFTRAANSVECVFQYVSAFRQNDTETIKSLAKGINNSDERTKDMAKLLVEHGIPKLYKTWFENHTAVVALGPVASNDEKVDGRFLLFTLSLVDERWSIVDIDLEVEAKLLERFRISPGAAIAPANSDVTSVNSAATADEAYQALEKLLSNPKMDWKSTERCIATAVTRMTSNIEFAKYVLDHFRRACAGGESNYQARRHSLAVLTRVFRAWGQSRWSTDPASIQQNLKPSETRPQEIRDFELSALESVVSYGQKATRSDIVDFVRAARALHHPDAKPFLQAVLLNPQTLNSSPYATPATVATPSKQSIWSDSVGGTWPDARFVAAVGLAELGDPSAIDWLLAKAKPNDFGLDEFIDLARHERDRSGSLRESSRCALVELFGQPKDSTVAQLSDWWRLNRVEVTPRMVELKMDFEVRYATQQERIFANARTVVEAYVASAISGDVAQATALAKNLSADPEQIRKLQNVLNVQRLKIETVYVSDPAKPTHALATSVAVKLDEEHKQPNGQRDGFMVFRLELTDDKWFVIDVDFESESGAERELKRFLDANPGSIGLPPQP